MTHRTLLLALCAVFITPALAAPALAASDDADHDNRDSDDDKTGDRKPSARIGGQVQARASFEPAVDHPETTVDEGALDPSHVFDLRRVRLDGRWRTKRWQLSTKFAFERAEPRVLNAYIEHRPVPWLELRGGQFKRNISLDYLVSSGAQRIYERSKVGDAIDGNRDIGVMVRAWPIDKVLDARVAVFNGSGTERPRSDGNSTHEDQGNYMAEARVDVHIGGEVDAERRKLGRRPRLMIGGAYSQGRIALPQKTQLGEKLSDFAGQNAWSTAIVACGWRHELRAEWLSRTETPTDARTASTTTLTADEQAVLQAATRSGGYIQWAWQLPIHAVVQTSARVEVYRPESGTDELFGVFAGAAYKPDKRVELSLHGWRRETSTSAGPFVRAGATLQLQMAL